MEHEGGEVLAAVSRMLAKLVRSSAIEQGDVSSALAQLTEIASSTVEVERASVWRFAEDRRIDCLDLYERGLGLHSSGQRSEHALDAHDGATLDAPIWLSGRLVGVVRLERARGSAWRAWEELVAGTLADCVSMILATAELVERERAAREEAESANRAKDEFLAMLGHELRNPLSPILTALYLMERLEHVAFEERAVIARQVAHLSRLVDDVLDVARITRGKIELRTAPVELSEAVAKGIELASPLLERHGHFLEVDVPDIGLEVDGDVERLAQVVSNLLNNAAKFTPRGGRIQIRGGRAGAYATLAVRDNGAGIPRELLPHLFDAFVQGERRLDRSQGGLGLGLAIVQGIVAAHGGDVTARSDGHGQGSELTFRIPLHVDAPAALDLDDDELAFPAAAPRRRILVVDDNVDAAEMLARALEQCGHETTTAFDGPTAVALASEFRPQLALLDLGLPVMDGFEVARKLKDLPGLGAIKLVALTGYGRAGDFERTKQAGFSEHMVKPIEVFQLEALLQALFASP